ncbi:MAG: GIY-YIG nuclease family protein [Candidatus Parcubacteria bacterium]|nr:GIY-YIG nuclease family protein [Candidatus Parcubacteria bacterium]
MDIDKDNDKTNVSRKSNENWCWVYILKSLKDNRLYIGSTTDLKKRIFEHQSGKVFATKNRLPVILLYYEAYIEEWMARKREKNLKYFGKAYQLLKKRLML